MSRKKVSIPRDSASVRWAKIAHFLCSSEAKSREKETPARPSRAASCGAPSPAGGADGGAAPRHQYPDRIQYTLCDSSQYTLYWRCAPVPNATNCGSEKTSPFLPNRKPCL